MGTRTLEARLRARLMLLAVPALALTAIVAVVATERLLQSSDTATARSYAIELRELYHREIAENDGPTLALSELREGVGPTEVRVSLRLDGQLLAAPGAPVPAARLLELGPGACASAPDAEGRAWRGCASGNDAETVIVAIPVEAHARAVTRLAEVLGGVVLLILIGLLLSIRGALRAPLEELDALVRWAGRPMEQGKTALPEAGTHEISVLQTAFEGLVGRLLDALARERAQSAHIAHELRTPLTAILAELDASAPATPAEQNRTARMKRDVERLAHAIDAILLLSDDGAKSRASTIVNLSDLARELASETTGVSAPDEALVEGDERLLRIALRNLLENADRYAGGARELDVHREGDLVRLSVIDAGPGVGEDARARMFDRYFRVAADGEGKGLGLALVRAVAERHGGRAEARPGPGGRGLEVSMLLGPVAGWHEARPEPH